MLQKHARYKDAYVPGDRFWGLGIENETYIELQGGGVEFRMRAAACKTQQQRERYSVDYWKLYKPGAVEDVLDAWMQTLPCGPDTDVTLPRLLNGHTFTKSDRFGEPITLYAAGTPPANPRFCGTTLLEDLERIDPGVFRDGRDVWWTFDGDTVEFMTQQFYCAKLEDVVAELCGHKERWLQALRNALPQLKDREAALYGVPQYPAKNHGLAVFLTNRQNIAIFNNGTLHFNLTLPTTLGKDGTIADMEAFRSAHQAVARLFQWLSPFLVAAFGSGDVFANLGRRSSGRRFPAGSQRLCASRYVSVGTYDTVTMPPGKIVTLPRTTVGASWHTQLYEHPDCAYIALNDIGLDINYQKHWNHGLEFRIFDWFPENALDSVLRLLIWMCDEALARHSVPVPRENRSWNAALARAVWEGTSALLTEEEATAFREVLGVPALAAGMTFDAAYAAIWATLRKRWNTSKNTITECMVRTPLPPDISDILPIALTTGPAAPIDDAAPQMGERRIETVLCRVPLRAAVPTCSSSEATPNHRVLETVPIADQQFSVWCCW